jgi:5-methylcytosine-specific restriction endonuclease McrA
MKLPDFRKFDKLIRVKVAMGVPPNQVGDIRAIEIRRAGPTQEEIGRLDGDGLEVEKEDVVPLPDGTLSYKDRRVLLYIRDIAVYGGGNFVPRFHISDCRTLQEMRRNQRFARFVIASRDDGLFQLHYIDSGRRKTVRLDVCQNCLDHLSYKGFQQSLSEAKRLAAVSDFSIPKFFEAYPKSLHRFTPTHTDLTAPQNVYNPDFPSKSRAYRQQKNWVCEECGISLSTPAMQRFLHVHHINGQRNDDDPRNLKALCIHCHAEQPSHGHMKAMLQYREFEPIWLNWRVTNTRFIADFGG